MRQLECQRAETAKIELTVAAELLQKQLQEPGYVIAAAAQWRHFDAHSIDPVVQILPESGHCADQLLEIEIGRADDPPMELHELLAAEPVELPSLRRA